ncbi:MAG: hypothetical protein ACOYMF_05625 [Bacteroidales bacterium]
MKKLVSILLLLFYATALFGQDAPPVGATVKTLQSPGFKYNTADSTVWMYKGATYGWNRLLTRRDSVSGSGGSGDYYWKIRSGATETESRTPNYGYLYNWYAVANLPGPNAHVPTNADFYDLYDFLALNDEFNRGGLLKETGTTYWNTPNTGAIDTYNFHARGGGWRNEGFSNLGIYGNWWTWDDIDGATALGRYVQYDGPDFVGDQFSKFNGMAVRLIVDTPIEVSGSNAIYVGNDGQRYTCVLIGSQWWMNQDLIETQYSDHSPIPVITDETLWTDAVDGARCSYNNNTAMAYTSTITTGATDHAITSRKVVEFKDSESVNWSVSDISDTLISIEARVDTSISESPIKLVATDNLVSTALDAALPHGYKSIALGDSAGIGSDSTFYSNYIGYMAGMNVFKGGGNNGIGFLAGAGTTNTIGCDFIGAGSGYESENSSSSLYLGNGAGRSTKNARVTNYIGAVSGEGSNTIEGSNLIGTSSGTLSDSIYYSNFIGYGAGNQADFVRSSNFIGNEAGSGSSRSNYSNMIGYQTGAFNDSTSYSNFIGYKAGYPISYGGAGVKNNNIIIGTNITLPSNSANRLNIGGILFGKNTYATTSGNPSISPTATGSIGIGVVDPIARLHLPAGTNTIAPLKIDSGALVSVKQKWIVENDGEHLYYTTKDTIRRQLDNSSSGGASYLYSIGTDSVEVSTFAGSGGDNLLMGQPEPEFDRYTWFDGDANSFFGSRTFPYAYTASGNTGIGAFAGYYLYAGNRNFLGGYASGAYLTEGNHNTLVGASTGYNPLAESTTNYQITTDSAMTLIGYGATKNNAARLHNGIAIGANAYVLQSDQVVLGNDSITSTLLKGTVTVPELKVKSEGYGAGKILQSDANGLLSYTSKPNVHNQVYVGNAQGAVDRVDLTGATITYTPRGNNVLVLFSNTTSNQAAAVNIHYYIHVGTNVPGSADLYFGGGQQHCSFQALYPVSAGTPITVKIQWSSGTAVWANSNYLTVIDLP